MARPASDPAAGLFGSLRRLLATLVEIAQLRIDLFSTEFEREKLRIFDGLLWGAVGVLFVGVGLLLLSALLVLLTPEAWRGLVLGLLALASLGLGVWLLQRSRQRLSSPGGPLIASRAELEQDRIGLVPPA